METFVKDYWSDTDMDPRKLTQILELEFRGNRFKALVNPTKGHPSSWSHMDEFITRDLWWNVGQGDIVLDVGADFGSYSLTALAAGASLVVAWSPPFKAASPAESHALSLSAWESGFEDRLLVETSGLWSERGWLSAMDGPRPPTLHRTREDALKVIEGQPGHCTVFPVKTLDEYLERAPLMVKDFKSSLWKRDRRWWLKIDTEGSELEVLRGARGFILSMRPTILVENHPHVLRDAESVVEEFLLGLRIGYEKVGTRPHFMVSHSLYEPPAQGAK
jgi:FkbM family methyltransferase